MYSKTGHACIRRTRGCETWLFVIPLRTVGPPSSLLGPPSNIWLSAWLRAGFKELPLAVFFSARRRFDVYLRTIAGIRRARFYYRTGARGSPKTDPSADDCSTIALASPRFVGALAVVVRRFSSSVTNSTFASDSRIPQFLRLQDRQFIRLQLLLLWSSGVQIAGIDNN